MTKPIHLTYHGLSQILARHFQQPPLPSRRSPVGENERKRLRRIVKTVYRALGSSVYVRIDPKLAFWKLLKHGIQTTYYVYSKGAGLVVLAEERDKVVLRTSYPPSTKLLRNAEMGENIYMTFLSGMPYVSVPFLLRKDLVGVVDTIGDGLSHTKILYSNQLSNGRSLES